MHASINIEGMVTEIQGTFRHIANPCISLLGRPFENLTYSVCSRIPQEGDFRLRVLREDSIPEKHGSRIQDKVEE
jgi:hypothetical protein